MLGVGLGKRAWPAIWLLASGRSTNIPAASQELFPRLHHCSSSKTPAKPPAMASEASQPPSKIRLLSLNCWGLKFISKLRNERLTEIGVQIAAASPQPEIVCLQECWTQQDYHAIREKTKHILPYGKFYHSGIFGGGLVILSRWPIVESNMVRYPLNGRPAAFYRGDWFVGKGVACAKIQIGPTQRDIAEVFCTHVCLQTLGRFQVHILT